MQPPPPPLPHPPLSRAWGAWAAWGGLLLIYLLRVHAGVGLFSQTIDETYHIGSAVALYEAKAHVLGVQHPPLPRWVAGSPLIFNGAVLPQYRGTTMSRKEDPAYEAGTEVLLGPDTFPTPKSYFQRLASARTAMLVFPAVALLYAMLIGRRLLDPWAGVGAAALLSLDPTFLGHGMWVCTDAAATAAFLAAAYHTLAHLHTPGPGKALSLGAALGLGIACKFSIALLVPALIGVLIVWRLGQRKWSKDTDRPPMSELLVHFGLIALVAFFALWATYLFRIGPIGNSDTLAAAPQWSRIPQWIKDLPVPMPAFWIGLARVAANSAQGSDAYLLGTLSKGGWWYYFPVLIALKTPLVLLAAGAAAGALLLWRPKVPMLLILVTLIPAATVLAAGMAAHIQIGIRHVLPAMAGAYVLAGAVLTRTRARAILLTVLAALATVETLRVHPDYLSFFNAAAGGPVGAERLAVDSNLDWGQDVARLGDWLKARPERSYVLWLFGSRQEPLVQVFGMLPALLDKPPTDGTLLCVSLSRLKLDLETDPRWAPLKDLTPIARIGYGIVVYDLAGDKAAPLIQSLSTTKPSTP